MLPPDLSRGACVGNPHPHIFYSDEPANIARAKAICHRCSVQHHCLTYALEHEEYGTWGGLTARERTNSRRQHQPHPMCGTEGGWYRHRRRNEPTCDACRQARHNTQRNRRNKEPAT